MSVTKNGLYGEKNGRGKEAMDVHFHQVSSGALHPVAGAILLLCIFGGVAALYMRNNKCFEQRVTIF